MFKVSTIIIILIMVTCIFVSCNNPQSIQNPEVTNTDINLANKETIRNDNSLANTNENQTSIKNDSDSIENNTNSTNKNKNLTIDDIKDNFIDDYPDATIISNNRIEDQYLLVEYLYEHADSANMFTLYDLKTGARNELPCTGFYTKLMKITDENNITLLSTGENSEVNTIYFPFVLNFHRDASNLDFTYEIESYFANLAQSIEFGDDYKTEVIYSIKQNPNGFNVYFKPLPGEDAQKDFIINEYIPLTTTSYDVKNKQFTIDFHKTSIDNDLIIERNDSDYYTSLNITNDSSNSKIVIDLKDNTKLYTAEVETITDTSICLKITFK